MLTHGEAPDGCDKQGAREALPFTAGGNYYMQYDGAGADGWTACLAVSDDLSTWKRLGTTLSLGKPGTADSASASSPWVIQDAGRWHMYYLGTPNASPAPERVPLFPYLTLYATSSTPTGPWTKHYDVAPFRPTPGTWYALTASPGFVVRHGNDWLQFFSGSSETRAPDGRPIVHRTLGLARTRNLAGTWSVSPRPIVPATMQVENSSVYYERANKTWFLFTNHVGIERGEEFTDGIWVFWTRDPLVWNPKDRALVLSTASSTWSKGVIGMPGVVQRDTQLHLFYDGIPGTSTSHVGRDIGHAVLRLPLTPPTTAR